MSIQDFLHCDLCPNMCGANRLGGQFGFCEAGAEAEIFSQGPHHGEEPSLSGSRGSGTVFFSRCTMKCIYCQNYPWSQQKEGEKYTQNKLTATLADLAKKGCHNWNLVSPTPWMPIIVKSLKELRQDGLWLPVVYNTSGFERVQVLEKFSDYIDIYLTDLRYASEHTAREGSGVRGYVGAARAALEKMWELAGPLQLDEHGIATGGVICRLLILPGRAEEAAGNLRWIAERFEGKIHVSLMAQYHPAYKATNTNGWNRKITRKEYDLVVGQMEKLGIDNGWVQEFEGETPSHLLGFRMKKNTL